MNQQISPSSQPEKGNSFMLFGTEIAMEDFDEEDPLNRFVADRLEEMVPPKIRPMVRILQEETALLEKAASLGLHVVHRPNGVIDLHTAHKPLFRCANETAAMKLLDDLRLENLADRSPGLKQ